MILLKTRRSFVLTFVCEGIYCSAARKSSGEPADSGVTEAQRYADVGTPRTAAPHYSKAQIQGKTQQRRNPGLPSQYDINYPFIYINEQSVLKPLQHPKLPLAGTAVLFVQGVYDRPHNGSLGP